VVEWIFMVVVIEFGSIYLISDECASIFSSSGVLTKLIVCPPAAVVDGGS